MIAHKIQILYYQVSLVHLGKRVKNVRYVNQDPKAKLVPLVSLVSLAGQAMMVHQVDMVKMGRKARRDCPVSMDER